MEALLHQAESEEQWRCSRRASDQSISSSAYSGKFYLVGGTQQGRLILCIPRATLVTS